MRKLREATALPSWKTLLGADVLGLGHLSRMECYRILRQAHRWEPDGFRRSLEGLDARVKTGVINKDLKKIGIG